MLLGFATGMCFSVENVFPVIVLTAVLHKKARMAEEPMRLDDPILKIEWNMILNEDLHNRGNVGFDDGETSALTLHYVQK